MFRKLTSGMAFDWPAQCAVCRSWPARPVCSDCVTRFGQPETRCETCALPVPEGTLRCGACLTSPSTELDLCLAAVPYAYPWSGLITRFKFAGHAGWARHFAELMRSAPWVDPALEAADGVIPMPLSSARMRQRGFNQAFEMARHLAPEKVRAQWLLRIRDTVPQSSLGRAERQNNVAQAFALDPLQAAQLAGRRLVLVDDVMTSGASLRAAARALRQAGATHITAIVLARTPAPAEQDVQDVNPGA